MAMAPLQFWIPPFVRITSIFVVGALVWLSFGQGAGALVVIAGLLAIIIVQLRYLQRLQRWLDDADAGAIPDGWGAWNIVFSTLYRARRRQEASRKGLTSALERIQLAAGALPDGVVLLTPDHHIEWCNAVAESHFGIDLSRDRGLLFTHIARHPVLAEYLAMAVAAPPVTMRPMQNPSQILSLQVIPFGESERLLLSRDVTAIERAETMRRDFVANVSHELRTPLTVISGFIEVLEGAAQLNVKSQRHLQLMREQAERMARLVDDLLTLSRLESEGVIAPATVVDVVGLCAELATNAESLSGQRQRITWNVDAGLAVTGNVNELRSAFLNLISNAVRYTPEGGEIEISWQLQGTQPAFAVRDNGIGIAAEHIPRLTERFYRVDTGRSRDTGGTGLGLAIVKHILVRHQAKLEIESDPGRGSTFRAVFPSRRGRRLVASAAPPDAGEQRIGASSAA